MRWLKVIICIVSFCNLSLSETKDLESKKIKKIGIIGSYTRGSQSGGTGRHYRSIQKHLEKSGIQVEVIGGVERSNFLFGVLEFIHKGMSMLFICMSSDILDQISACDAIHIYDTMPGMIPLTHKLKKLNIPFTISSHMNCSNTSPLKPFIRYWAKKIAQSLCRDAVKVFVPSDFWAEHLKSEFNIPQDKILVIPNGFDPEIFNMEYGQEYYDLKFYLENVLKLSRPWHICVSRISYEKNLPMFLDMDLSGSKILVGDGQQFAEYKKKYPDVVFLGYKSGRELAACYQNADVFVLTSTFETFGMAALESMACGTPVVAFDYMSMIIRDGENGILVNENHKEDFPQAIDRALKLDRYRVSSTVHNDNRFDWRKIAREFYSHLAFMSQ